MKRDNNITYEDNSSVLDNVYIRIFVKNYMEYPSKLQKLLNTLLTHITQDIGAKTTINYHAGAKVSNGNVYINVYYYNERIDSDEALINKRLKELLKYFDDFDVNSKSSGIICLMSTLKSHNVPVEDVYGIQVVNRKTKIVLRDNIDIHLKRLDKLKRVKVTSHTFKDDSRVLIINDKCASTYGLFVNLTVPFNEMGMSYNALHLYEHLMMCLFKGSLEKDIVESNGCTYPNGLCYVYNIHNTLKSLNNQFKSVIKELMQMRKEDYWEKSKEDIERETIRTISETRESRTLNDMGRSDLKAFSKGYDKNIFKYWSNKPFEIILTGPEELSINFSAISKIVNSTPRLIVKKPSTVTFKNIPIDVIRTKEASRLMILKETERNIKDIFLNIPLDEDSENNCSIFEDGSVDYGKYGYLYGLDNKIVCLEEDFGDMNTFTSFLMINKLFTTSEVEEVLNKNMLPMYAELYSTQSLR